MESVEPVPFFPSLSHAHTRIHTLSLALDRYDLFRSHCMLHTLSITLSLSLTHTHTHMRTHKLELSPTMFTSHNFLCENRVSIRL